jgi:hypothetical protein
MGSFQIYGTNRKFTFLVKGDDRIESLIKDYYSPY